MRTSRLAWHAARAWLTAAVVVGSVGVVGGRADAQTPTAPTEPAPRSSMAAGGASSDAYAPTLFFGTGLINDPVAWVSPASSDFWLSYGALKMDAPHGGIGTPSHLNGNFALDTHWANRFSVGLSVYSNNPEWGFFGQVLALHDGELKSFLPAIAVGARNLGPFNHEERFLIGSDVVTDSTGHTHEVTPSYFKRFHTAPSLYAVATKEIHVNAPALSSLSLTVGGGDGIFSDNGGLGAAYDKSGTVVRGLFFGARTLTHLGTDATISLIGENDGWDWNAGVIAGWRGLSAGLYGVELDKPGTVSPASLSLYNYRKFALTLGYSGNFVAVANGHVLRTQIASLEREQQQLRTEVAHREHVIAQLASRLSALQQGEFGNAGKQRQELEAELQQERDAIQRANDRLKQLQGEKPQ